MNHTILQRTDCYQTRQCCSWFPFNRGEWHTLSDDIWKKQTATGSHLVPITAPWIDGWMQANRGHLCGNGFG